MTVTLESNLARSWPPAALNYLNSTDLYSLWLTNHEPYPLLSKTLYQFCNHFLLCPCFIWCINANTVINPVLWTNRQILWGDTCSNLVKQINLGGQVVAYLIEYACTCGYQFKPLSPHLQEGSFTNSKAVFQVSLPLYFPLHSKFLLSKWISR